MAVEVKGDPRKIEPVLIRNFFRGWRHHLHISRLHDIGKIFVQSGQGGGTGRMLEPDDEFFTKRVESKLR